MVIDAILTCDMLNSPADDQKTKIAMAMAVVEMDIIFLVMA